MAAGLVTAGGEILLVSTVEFAKLVIGIAWPITSSDASNSLAMSISKEELFSAC